MATIEEDFSFPVITETHQASIDSPPLWHLSPASSPNHNYSCNKLLPKEDYYKQRKSCSNIDMTHYNGTEEDKMDFLWEDHFNQEVSKLEANNNHNIINSSAGDMMELGCVQALKFSKNGNGAIFSASKKPSIVVFIKVLKKLFLIHKNSHHNNRSMKQNRA